ncbi:MAG: hypothetical protein ABH869_00760, partial [Candidatus Omnitrophota bacterium]
PHVRFDEGMLETGYGQDNEALPKETGRNRKYKRCPEAIAPVFYSTMVQSSGGSCVLALRRKSSRFCLCEGARATAAISIKIKEIN